MIIKYKILRFLIQISKFLIRTTAKLNKFIEKMLNK
jgi:hypothetical protein